MDIIDLYHQPDGYYGSQPPGLGNIFDKIGQAAKDAAKGIIKVTQKIDPVSNLLSRSDVGKTIVGKILVPSSIKVSPQPTPTKFTDATVIKREFSVAAQNEIDAQQSQQLIAQAEAVAKKKKITTIAVVSGAVLIGGILIIAATHKKPAKALSGVPAKRKGKKAK